jgi:hypothetical protein
VSITLSAAAAATSTQITLTHANANDGSMILDSQKEEKKIPFFVFSSSSLPKCVYLIIKTT